MPRPFNYDSLKRLLDATTRDYDENGTLLTIIQARLAPNSARVTTTTTYDELNRPGTRSYNDSTLKVTHCYDGKIYSRDLDACTGTATAASYGQVTAWGNTTGSTNYTHDDQGQVASSTQFIDTFSAPLTYQYYADDTFSMMTIPGPKNRVTCYDVQGRAIWVSGQLSTVDCVNGTAATAANSYGWVGSFASHGAIQELNFGAGSNSKERWCYNGRLQVSGMRLGSAGSSDCTYQSGDIFGLRLEYTSSSQAHNNGNLMQQYIQMRKSAVDSTEIRFKQDYGYDSLNRITSAQEFVEAGTGNGWQRGWTYDAVGNLAASSNGTLPAGTPSTQAQYEQTTNRLKYFRSTLQPADLINYDASGNLTDRPANLGSRRTTYEYDAENRLRKVDGGATQENFYDGLGRRVKRVAGSTTVKFVYDASGQLVLEYDSRVSVAGVQFLTTDHLGSTRVATRPDGSVVSRMDYEPFGVEAATAWRVAEGYAGDPSLRVRFTGKERDAESGLDYFGARFLSAAMGRFVSPDPVNMGARIRGPQSWNMYSYALNNPQRYVDPTGMWSTDIHNQIIQKAFPGLSPRDIRVLQQISAGQDSLIPGQSRRGSFKHAMRAPWQTVAQAKAQYEQFIASEMTAAQNAQFGSFLNSDGTAGIFKNALEAFARLLHAVTDETSPAHEGFQSWEWYDFCDARLPGCDSGSVKNHTDREDWSAFTPQREAQAVEAARKAFSTTFGSGLYWYALHGKGEPTGCVSASDSASGTKSKTCE